MRRQGPGPISRPLAGALRDVADRGDKAIVLLNRRGVSLMALCRSCGWVARCPDCDVPMVVHGEPDRLECHHCGRERGVPRGCPSCGAIDIARQGVGTEGLGRALERAAPVLRRVRLDAETSAGGSRVGEILAEFAAPGPAVLFGTQMVAKGHDLPDVGLAAVIDADAGLARADFRAEERTFDLIVQARGRAGRRGEPARVIVQAWEPGARALRLAVEGDVEGFLAGEIRRREAHGYPPWGHLVRAVLDGDELAPVRDAARALVEGLRADGLTARGPGRLHRLRGRHRRSVLVLAERAGPAADALEARLESMRPALSGGGVRAIVDVDPQET
jgi:primosomal protein N' (replication factor Y)